MPQGNIGSNWRIEMKLKCPECNIEAVKSGRAINWTCPECHAVIEELTQETGPVI